MDRLIFEGNPANSDTVRKSIDKTIVFGQSPWPNQYGAPFNRNTTATVGAAQGQVLWSVELPARLIKNIAVGEGGRCFIVQRERGKQCHLLAIEEGRILWQTTYEQYISQPVPLTDNRLIVQQGETLWIKSQEDGAVIQSIPLKQNVGIYDIYVTPQGYILYDTWKPDKTRQMEMMTLQGDILWSYPLANSLTFPPLVIGERIIFDDDPFIVAANLQGERQWLANQEGFQDVGGDKLSSKQVNLRENGAETPIIWLGDNKILAGLRWYTGYGFHLFDLEERTVKPLGPPFLRAPFAVVEGAQGFCLVACNVLETVAMDLHSNLLWRYEAVKPPQSIIGDAAGKVFISYSPSYEMWEKYKNYYQQEQCFLKCFEAATGQEIFTWSAPGPIARVMAVGEGCIYVAADQRLWAIR